MTSNPGFELYVVLGVGTNATQDEIKHAYRRLAKSAHPDAGGSPEQFDRIKAAYSVLSSPVRRDVYDRTGEVMAEKLDNRQGMVMGEINKYLMQMLSHEQPLFNVDVIGVLRDFLRKEIDGNIKGTVASKRALDRIGRLQRERCLRPKIGEVNLFVGVLDWHQRQAEQHLQNVADKNKLLQEAIDLLDQYEFVADDMGVRPRQAISSMATSSAGLNSTPWGQS